MRIDAATLRLTWEVIEEIAPPDLLSMSDTAIAKVILQHISKRLLLSGEELCLLYEYVGSRVPLIRDMAESRQAIAPAIGAIAC
jgi:hypothetical protein